VIERVIDARGLRKSFGETLAVDDLSLTVGAGRSSVSLGPNGAGRRRRSRCCSRSSRPTRARARCWASRSAAARRAARVGFLPEHCRFHDSLTARELVRFHGRLHGMRGQALETRIDQLLSRVDMLDAADRPLRGYSKGMLQRAGLAQALVQRSEAGVPGRADVRARPAGAACSCATSSASCGRTACRCS
jgi:ABC-2 type transport system ATP-binding protein